MKRGSVSVFTALCLMLIASALFTFLEGARVWEQRRVLQEGTDAGMESFFAGYDKIIWDDYRILTRSAGACQDFLDLQEIKQEFDESSEYYLNPPKDLLHWNSSNYLRAECKGVSVKSFTLLTDGDGGAFQQAVAAYMQKNIAKEAVQSLKELYDTQKEMKAADVDKSVKEAKEGIEKAKEEEAKEKKQASSKKEKSLSPSKGMKIKAKKNKGKEEKTDDSNPLEVIASIKKTGILSLVLPKDAKVSDRKVDLKNVVSHRELEQGDISVEKVTSAQDLFLIQLYYAKHFSDYFSPNEKGGLAYEREYLLGGKESDEKNLKSCITKILASREAANLLAIYANDLKREEARSLAILLAGATANPVIIELVLAGILAAWAFVESILDLRTLMDGGRIPLVKTPELWTSDIAHLSDCTSSDFKAQECDAGMCYSDFLNLLLYTQGSGKMALRALDIIETAVRAREGYKKFRADHMLLAMEIYAEYEYSQNFLSLVVLKKLSGTRFTTQVKSSYSYLKAGG